jgi:hypothetical protein
VSDRKGIDPTLEERTLTNCLFWDWPLTTRFPRRIDFEIIETNGITQAFDLAYKRSVREHNSTSAIRNCTGVAVSGGIRGAQAKQLHVTEFMLGLRQPEAAQQWGLSRRRNGFDTNWCSASRVRSGGLANARLSDL